MYKSSNQRLKHEATFASGASDQVLMTILGPEAVKENVKNFSSDGGGCGSPQWGDVKNFLIVCGSGFFKIRANKEETKSFDFAQKHNQYPPIGSQWSSRLIKY